jgi:hypothetical protein
MPISLTFRGTAEDYLSYKLALFEPGNRTASVEGRTCVELVRLRRASKQRDHLYLDPEREYVPRRLDTYTEDKLTFRLTVEHTADPSAGWVPQSWTYVMRSATGTPVESAKATVTRYEINPAVDPGEFKPALPPKTLVIDETKGTMPSHVSVVRDDGTRGVELPGLSVGYEEARAANESSDSDNTTLALGAAAISVVVILVAVCVTWQIRRRWVRP